MALNQSGIRHSEYNGAMRGSAKTEALKTSCTDPSVRVMLLTVGCSDVGLNLTAVIMVIVLSPLWSPVYASAENPDIITTFKDFDADL